MRGPQSGGDEREVSLSGPMMGIAGLSAVNELAANPEPIPSMRKMGNANGEIRFTAFLNLWTMIHVHMIL